MEDIAGLRGVVGTIGDFYKGLEKPPATDEAGSGFVDFIKTAIDKVNSSHSEAEQSIVSLATGSGAGIHETMIAMEKAEVNFELLMELRNKVISAYEEVMRMSI